MTQPLNIIIVEKGGNLKSLSIKDFKLEGDESKLDRKVVGTPSYNRRIEILKKLGVTDTSEFEERWAEFDKHEGF
jgi:hypothetical protein